jgi:hypothetical protein
MKNLSLYAAGWATFLLLGCADTSQNKPRTVYEPTPGNPKNCVIYIPYKYSDFGGSIQGSFTAAQVPGVSASLKRNTTWGFVAYAGECGDPKTWQKIATPGPEATKPTDDKSKSIAVKANQVGVALVAASSRAPLNERLVAETASFYSALNRYSPLKPYKGNTMPIGKIISSLKNAGGTSVSGSAPPPPSPTINANPQSISNEADRLIDRLNMP